MTGAAYEAVTAALLERPTRPMPLEHPVPLEELPTPVLLLDEAGASNIGFGRSFNLSALGARHRGSRLFG